MKWCKSPQLASSVSVGLGVGERNGALQVKDSANSFCCCSQLNLSQFLLIGKT